MFIILQVTVSFIRCFGIERCDSYLLKKGDSWNWLSIVDKSWSLATNLISMLSINSKSQDSKQENISKRTFLRWSFLYEKILRMKNEIFTLRYDAIKLKTDSCVLNQWWLKTHDSFLPSQKFWAMVWLMWYDLWCWSSHVAPVADCNYCSKGQTGYQ